jgi:hypothetical protein
MRPGALIMQAKKDAQGIRFTGLLLAGICVFVFALHWKRLFNTVTGPHALVSRYLEDPGAIAYVGCEGSLMEFGHQVSNLKFHGMKIGSGAETAKYMLMEFGGKMAVVKVPPEFVGSRIAGEIEPPPAEIRAAISGNHAFYPNMINAETPYYLDYDITMFLAALAFPFALLLSAYGAYRLKRVETHPALSGLKGLGLPLLVAEQIESELASLEHNRHEPPVYFSDAWIVFLDPTLKIFPVGQVVRFGCQADKRGKKSLLFWLKGKSICSTVLVPQERIGTAVEALGTRFPSRFAADADAFEKAWLRDRKRLEAAEPAA